MSTLTGKAALVTGGASGIGRATALALAEAGAAVAIVDVNATLGAAVVAEIMATGGQALFLNADVTRAADCERVIAATLERFDRLDILFNNAGIIRRANVIDTTEEEWDRVMAVNVKSIFLMCKYAVPVMANAGGGSIINTGSGWGLKGGGNAASYCASKGAVVNLTRAMAIDHGPANIRVNCVCPGDTDTPMLRHEAQQLGQAEASFLAEAAERPLRRFGRPSEIAQAVLYLAGDAASYVTGAALVVDGGGLA
ncbi:MAG TPA: SDR family NAD(P)-dependent oxidoreductase [Anaerolineales bacterium]|nr:SDR family NAD(P)-dependent oxidoreductase [Anaerolineales bacterium]HRF47403.1 SDR family NAD(P)-dependent oxidoreductase [Anaerolineales bacterium]